jgi:hypothetical protein
MWIKLPHPSHQSMKFIKTGNRRDSRSFAFAMLWQPNKKVGYPVRDATELWHSNSTVSANCQPCH